MTLPNHPDKHGEPALVTPWRSVEYAHDDPPPAPERVVLVYTDDLLDHAAATYETTAFDAFGEGRALDRHEGVGVVRVPGVGAPSAVMAMEPLVARGTETVVSVGYAGGLQPDLSVGDLVVVDRALRDEGTSYHYREPGVEVAADGAVRDALAGALDAAGESYRVGPAWTTDAPYRETGTEVARYREAGVLAVDMEAAATFAVADYRGIEAGALFAVSDLLDPEGWEPRFDETAGPLRGAFDRAVAALAP